MLKNREGETIKNIEFKVIEDGTWKTINSDDIFANRTVVVFALPGAFTPTCSSTHLPRYNELAPIFKENGVDEIVCLSVNDTFVMNEWARDQEADNITLIPDGNGAFAEEMGLLVDKSAIGFGKRSWRYSMLVKDKKVEKMFIEPEKEGDPFEVSDADTILKFINPNVKFLSFATLFTRKGCPHCARAKNLLNDKGIIYEEIELSNALTNRSMVNVTGAATTPQVYLDGKYIGTADQLEAHFKAS
ncbi:MAG: glutathione peroxidase [Candidatus Caenarcaniphilales bacterium]|nr:glutathione peroxidase [Candidatus Caenarcaniphilales bacterium]